MTAGTNSLNSWRSVSLDAFRALTMFLMIFVNDLWTLEGVPSWLEHAGAGEDKLGFADTIFPAFVFIVGMSIPLSVGKRLGKETAGAVLAHIALRSLALVVMGIYHVNLEHYDSADALIPKAIWEILITVAFFLIWLDYPAYADRKRKWAMIMTGVMLLAGMGLLYVGGEPGAQSGMRVHWWGILGLIGWTYLIAAILFIVFRNHMPAYAALLLFFVAFNSASALHWLDGLSPLHEYVWIVGDGSLPAMAIAGIITSLAFLRWNSQEDYGKFLALMLGVAGVLILFGVITRPVWGINKIRATPAWTTICTGLSMLAFLFLNWLVDRRGRRGWYALLQPGGTNTLVCYLLPYIHYSLYALIGVSLPLFLRTGIVGIVKSLLYAFAIIFVGGILEAKRVKLKL